MRASSIDPIKRSQTSRPFSLQRAPRGAHARLLGSHRLWCVRAMLCWPTRRQCVSHRWFRFLALGGSRARHCRSRCSRYGPSAVDSRSTAPATPLDIAASNDAGHQCNRYCADSVCCYASHAPPRTVHSPHYRPRPFELCCVCCVVVASSVRPQRPCTRQEKGLSTWRWTYFSLFTSSWAKTK